MIRAVTLMCAGAAVLAGAFLRFPQAPCGPVFETFFTTADFYSRTISAAPPLEPGPGVVGMTVNHHLVGGNLAARMFSVLARVKPRRVILISPDHFAAGSAPVTVSSASWNTPFGRLPADCGSVELSGIRDDTDAFAGEHGISALAPYIRYFSPHSEVVSVMVKKNATKDDIETTAKRLSRIIDEDTFVIGSFDFSHYQPKDLADIHDATSQYALESVDEDEALRSEVDSPPGLALTILLARVRSTHTFRLVSHANSADITGESDPDQTTSYVDGLFLKTTAAPEAVVTAFLEPGTFDRPELSSERSQQDVMEAERQILSEKGTDMLLDPNSKDIGASHENVAVDYVSASQPDAASRIMQLRSQGHFVIAGCARKDMQADLVLDCDFNPVAFVGQPLRLKSVAVALVVRGHSVSVSFMPVIRRAGGYTLAPASTRAAVAYALSQQFPRATISHITITVPR